MDQPLPTPRDGTTQGPPPTLVGTLTTGFYQGLAVARKLDGESSPFGLPGPAASLLTTGLITAGFVTQLGVRGLLTILVLPAVYLGSGLAGAVVRLAASALDKGPVGRTILSVLAALPGSLLASLSLGLAFGSDSVVTTLSLTLITAAVAGPVVAWRTFADLPYSGRAT